MKLLYQLQKTCISNRYVLISRNERLTDLEKLVYLCVYDIYPKNPTRQSRANCINPDQTQQIAASDLGLHCLPLILTVLDASAVVNWTCSYFRLKYGKDFRGRNILGKIWYRH